MDSETQKKTGRDAGGKFAKGNKAGKGNPYAKKAAQWRRAMYNSVTDAEIAAVIQKMKDDALNGTARDADLFLTRLLGTPGTGIDLLERLEKLEALLDQTEAKDKENTRNIGGIE